MSQQSHSYRTNRDLFSNYYLTEHLRQTEPWEEVDQDELHEVYDELHELWEDKKHRVKDYTESSLEDNFIRPIFGILGIPFEVEQTVKRSARRPDYGFFPSAEAGDTAYDRDDFYEEAIAVADAKRWGRKLDTRGEEKRDFENPSYQIHAYLQETPPQWAVLTNGKQWRIYYGPTSHRLDSYYEIDLPELFEFVEGDGGIEDFKDFYLFFRQQAFLPDRSGDCFLDDVYDESSVFAEAIGEDLQNNIYDAIRVLAEGFLDTNDELDEGDLPLIRDSSLIYLYRLIFVLYAESEGRDLLPTDNDIYSESYSLNELKQTVAAKRDETQQQYQTWQTNLWGRLEELFVLIDQGSQGRDIPKDQLYIPAYNGGLFRTTPDPDDSEEAQFLATHEADDAHLAAVLDLLTRRDADEGDGQVFVDYSSLDERHLGSIYEGLLEYTLEVADGPLTVDAGEYSPAGDGDEIKVDEGEVYLRTDAGERKATGSYYTPEYVVEYIVDETLGPLVDGIRQDLVGTEWYTQRGFAGEFADRVFDLKILDPAMGSGHFLVNAVDYLAREIIDAQERQDLQAVKRGDEDAMSDPRTEDGELRDINWARRKVAQRCIYGVDLNPLATELAKVSLWLRTLAADQPLAFLDHHLKTGNSLVGSDIEDVLSNSDDDNKSGQTQLSDWMDQARRRAIEHVMERFTDLLSIDNETLADIKEMEEVYQEVREDPFYQHLLAMANVHTASEFGLDMPDDAQEQMAKALRDESWRAVEKREWFRSAQAIANTECFFHWELEFPVAFYDSNGNRTADAGFDAVIGNPPYISAWNRDLGQDDFLRANYRSAAGHYDIYGLFIEKGSDLLRRSGWISMIIPDTFCGQAYAENCRKLFTTDLSLAVVLDLRDRVVFEDAQVDNIIFVATGGPDTVETVTIEEELASEFVSRHTLPYEILSEKYEYRIPLSEEGLNISLREKIATGVEIQDAFYVSKGMEPHTADGNSKYDFIEKDDPDHGMSPYIEGKHIGRWRIHSNWHINYSPNQHKAPAFRELFESKKIVGARTIGKGRPMFAVDEYGYYNNEKTLNAVPYEELQGVDVSQVKITEQNLRYGKLFSLYAVMSLLNSKLTAFTFREIESGALDFFPRHLKKICLPKPDRVPEYDGSERNTRTGSTGADHADRYALLHELGREMSGLQERRAGLNSDLLDYLGNYEEGPKLPDVGLYQPTGSSTLDATTEEYDRLRVGDVRTETDCGTVTIYATVRYKPKDEASHETDRWGYTETGFHEAFSLTELSDMEAALVEAFVPTAVETGDGFAGFRDNATKTNSPVDRLKSITLPTLEDVADDLRRYVEVTKRKEELNEQIEDVDRRINDTVYDLYGLTDEEIETVEEAVTSD